MPQMTNKIDGYNFQHDSRVTPNLCFHFDVPKYLSQLPFPKKTHFSLHPKNHPQKNHPFSSFGIFLCIQKITPKKSSTIHQCTSWKSNSSPVDAKPPRPKAPWRPLPVLWTRPSRSKAMLCRSPPKISTSFISDQTPKQKRFGIWFLREMCGSGLQKMIKQWFFWASKVSTNGKIGALGFGIRIGLPLTIPFHERIPNIQTNNPNLRLRSCGKKQDPKKQTA